MLNTQILKLSASSLLDTIVVKSHKIQLLGIHYHPYFMAHDVGLLAALAMAFVIARLNENIAIWKIIVCSASTFYFPGYPLYLKFKQILFGNKSRSYLQDTCLFLLPCCLIISWLLGQPIVGTIDYLGLVLPLIIGIMRIGCFCSGCCYGKPSEIGVLYPSSLLVTHKISWRTYTPGIDPGCRVFPIQLVESGYNLILFGVLLTRLAVTHTFDGKTLPIYLVAYGGFRFFAEFYRGHRHRPKLGIFSEAQWLSLLLVTVCTVFLWVSSKTEINFAT